jgi:hypothetical protein
MIGQGNRDLDWGFKVDIQSRMGDGKVGQFESSTDGALFQGEAENFARKLILNGPFYCLVNHLFHSRPSYQP